MGQLQNPHDRKHLPALDSVRGAAIFGVFCYHLLAATFGGGHEQLKWAGWFRDFRNAPPNFLWFYPCTFGWVGVSLFFVLSGFVIHYSTVTTNRPFSLIAFYSRRFWRIYPPYAIAIVLFFLLPSSAPPADVKKLSLATHLLLVHDFSNKTFALINPSFWSIATEVQFYLVYPLLLLLRPRMGMLKVLLGILSFSLASRVLICVAERHHPECFEDSHLMLWTIPFITIFDWTLGAFLAERFAHGKRVFPNHIGILLAAGLVFVASTMIRPTSIFSFQFASIFCAIWIERVVWSERPLSFIFKLLIPLGLCSYSFYLFHQPLLEIMLKYGASLTAGSPARVALMCAPIIFLILLALSSLIYWTVEKPSMELGRALARSNRNPAPPVADAISVAGKTAP